MSASAIALPPQPMPAECFLPPWIYPPTDFEGIDVIAYVALPAIAASATIVSFQVPPGYNGIITNVANNFVGGGWVEGSGAVVWQILRDTAAVEGYDNVVASLGSPAAPVRLPAGFRIFENQVIAVTVKNVSVIVAGQLSGARLMGWRYPKSREAPGVWI